MIIRRFEEEECDLARIWRKQYRGRFVDIDMGRVHDRLERTDLLGGGYGAWRAWHTQEHC